MKAENLKTKTEDELRKMLLDARKARFNQRFQKTQGTLEKTDEIRKTRRNIARIRTFLNRKKSQENAAPAPKKAAAKKSSEKAA